MTPYVPKAGDIVWLHFDLQAAHEQVGHRPAFVLSPATYNGRTGPMLFCPMTTAELSEERRRALALIGTP